MQDFESLIGRMCHYYGDRCNGCPLDYLKNMEDCSCDEFIAKHRKQAEEEARKWAASHKATRQTKTPETRREILQAAERCVCGDRDRDYGSPENSFEAIGALWGSYLWHKNDLGKPGNTVGKNFIEPKDVAAMMTLFKMARVATGQDKADNWVDAAGYAACGGEIASHDKA